MREVLCEMCLQLWMCIAGAIINSDYVVKLEDLEIDNDMYSSWNEKEILMCYQ